jgi:hypothetical protein
MRFGRLAEWQALNKARDSGCATRREYFLRDGGEKPHFLRRISPNNFCHRFNSDVRIATAADGKSFTAYGKSFATSGGKIPRK